ncbi:CBS domain-containing protein [Alkalicoccus urumqiensis]|uniref:CBS domain-containing protein n=2 Tax=Alkalicoccus urumqiensis TaxID=1548213 RepID=A0A2P6MKS5_ALKUR|nr:CBS domain-containing protein [Alkalicoccus urumqiensis]
MQIKYNIIPAAQVVTCSARASVQEALNTLEESGYRCIPAVDEGKFKGNIYAQTLYRALWLGEIEPQDMVEPLLKDSLVHIDELTSFFRVFSSIQRYPYLAVSTGEGSFSGILTHSNVMNVLEDSWGIKTGNYTLTISTNEYQGALSAILTTVKKFTSIHSMMTLDQDSTFFRRIILTLPSSIKKETLTQLIQELESIGFRVSDPEVI